MADQNFTVDTGLTVTGTGGNITGANNIVAANTVSVSGTAGDITMTGGNITGFNTLVGNTANITLTANTASWTFDTTARLSIPNNGVITTPDATSGDGGYHVDILGGASDQGTWNTNPGGNVNIQGGYGSYNDGTGAIGGAVNLFGGLSPENTSGNVNIFTGTTSNYQWTFDNSGNMAFPSAGAFMTNLRVVTGGSVPSGFFPTYYNPTTGEFIVVTS